MIVSLMIVLALAFFFAGKIESIIIDKKHEILNSVVRLISVDVMHFFVRRKHSAKKIRHDHSMLFGVSIWARHRMPNSHPSQQITALRFPIWIPPIMLWTAYIVAVAPAHIHSQQSSLTFRSSGVGIPFPIPLK